jgi:fumarylacetoacetase
MHLRSAAMRKAKLPPARLSRGNLATSYWTPAQMLAHHASNGCNLRPGDLLGSGTISGPQPDSLGALIELTQGGKNPLTLPGGETRSSLADGDEVIETGYCRNGRHRRIGFGAAAGTVRP